VVRECRLPISQKPRVRTGLTVLRDQMFAPLKGKRIGVVTHSAAVDDRLRSAAELLAEAPGVELAVLFGPEHGFEGAAQDLIAVVNGRDVHLQTAVISLYGATFDSLQPTPEMLRGLDALVIDLQDIGSRYYTFQATMLLCFEAAWTGPIHWAGSLSRDRFSNPVGKVSSGYIRLLPGTASPSANWLCSTRPDEICPESCW